MARFAPSVMPAAQRTLAPNLVLAGAVLVLALPSAVLAVASRIDTPIAGEASDGGGDFSDGALDARLSRAVAAGRLAAGSLFHFTPAGLATRPQRSLTVAVWVAPETARTIIVHATPRLTSVARATAPVQVAPAAYDLTMGRSNLPAFGGWQNYASANEPRRPDSADISNFSLTAGNAAAGTPSRLSPHVELGEHDRAGRAPRTLESSGEQTVDLGGSYRLGRNLDVTAGVRYSQDRDRLPALVQGKQQDQAVFVGTQFKF